MEEDYIRVALIYDDAFSTSDVAGLSTFTAEPSSQ